MRILFISPYVPSLIRVRPYNFIRELAGRHEISVLATGSLKESAEVANLRLLCRSVDIVPLRLLASLHSCAKAYRQGDPLQGAFCRSRELERRLFALLERQKFDVIHVEHLRGAYVRSFIPDTFPTVFDSVDCISLLLERTLRSSHSLRQRLIAALELRRTRAYEAHLMHLYDRIAVTSAEDGRALGALAPRSEVVVVPNGVDLEYFRPLGRQRETATIVFSGKMSYHANVTAALHFVHHIFPLVRRAYPDVRLQIVGSNPPAAICKLARDPAISVTGFLPDIRQAIGRATLAICPVTVKVGIQNKVLEAMAMGLPVVCTKEGAEGLAAEHGQHFLVAAGPSEFGDQVCRLLAEPELADRLGLAGRRYVERNHRWDLAARQLETLYLEAKERRAQFLKNQSNRLPSS